MRGDNVVNNVKMTQLANEAKNLIMEFLEEENTVHDNDLNLKRVEVNKDGTVISVFEDDEEKSDYNITDISFSMSRLYDQREVFKTFIEIAKKKTNKNYKNMSKQDFIQSMGNLHYVERRCKEIFERLEEIEDEVNQIC